MPIEYSSGYKYQLKANVVIQTTLRPDRACVIYGFIYLDVDGLLYIYKGYAWDGCSFAPDWRFNLLAGLVHDALYQLIQAGLLDPKWKGEADLMFRSLMMNHGSPKIVAQIFYSAVDKFGHLFIRAERDVLSVD